MQRALVVVISLVALAALFTPREALATRTHLTQIKLAELVNRSSLVLRVKPAAMPKVTELITVDAPPGSWAVKEGKDVPQYSRVRHRYVVQAVERGSGVKKGATIEVDDANFESNLELHRRYYVDGVGKSPKRDAYTPIGNLQGARELVLFLVSKPSGLELTVIDSREATSELAVIRKLIAKAPAPDAPIPAPRSPLSCASLLPADAVLVAHIDLRGAARSVSLTNRNVAPAQKAGSANPRASAELASATVKGTETLFLCSLAPIRILFSEPLASRPPNGGGFSTISVSLIAGKAKGDWLDVALTQTSLPRTGDTQFRPGPPVQLVLTRAADGTYARAQ